jgi:hypothetical protein
VKTKGKAAIDVICNPLGKSGGALIQQFMILGFGSLAASTPYLGAILLTIVLLWINAANSLSGQFAEEQRKMEADIASAGLSTSSTDGSVSGLWQRGGGAGLKAHAAGMQSSAVSMVLVAVYGWR